MDYRIRVESVGGSIISNRYFSVGFKKTVPYMYMYSKFNQLGLITDRALNFIHRKVASRSTCYYSENQVFVGATNRDMSLNETCYYS